MSKKTRYFVLSAVAVLAIGLTTGLVASYLGLPIAVFSRAAAPEELQYVPADAAVVAYADVRQVMGSQFRERFRRLEPDTAERDEFERRTGINIEQDIYSVVAAMMPGEGRQPATGVIVLARGRFEQDRLEALAVEHGGQVAEYRGKRLLASPPSLRGEVHPAVAFLDADLVAIGTESAIHRAIDASTGVNVISNLELMRQIQELENNSAWAVGRFDALTREAALPSEIGAHALAIQWFSAAGQINGGLSGVFKAEARDEEAGQNLRDMLRGLLALGRLQAASRPELKGMMDSLQLSGDGRNVAIAFTVPTELFDALDALGRQQRR